MTLHSNEDMKILTIEMKQRPPAILDVKQPPLWLCQGCSKQHLVIAKPPTKAANSTSCGRPDCGRKIVVHEVASPSEAWKLLFGHH